MITTCETILVEPKVGEIGALTWVLGTAPKGDHLVWVPKKQLNIKLSEYQAVGLGGHFACKEGFVDTRKPTVHTPALDPSETNQRFFGN